jgi:hypothetical protein
MTVALVDSSSPPGDEQCIDDYQANRFVELGMAIHM